MICTAGGAKKKHNLPYLVVMHNHDRRGKLSMAWHQAKFYTFKKEGVTHPVIFGNYCCSDSVQVLICF